MSSLINLLFPLVINHITDIRNKYFSLFYSVCNRDDYSDYRETRKNCRILFYVIIIQYIVTNKYNTILNKKQYDLIMYTPVSTIAICFKQKVTTNSRYKITSKLYDNSGIGRDCINTH